METKGLTTLLAIGIYNIIEKNWMKVYSVQISIPTIIPTFIYLYHKSDIKFLKILKIMYTCYLSYNIKKLKGNIIVADLYFVL